MLHFDWGHRSVHASSKRIGDSGLVQTCHVLRAELLDLRSPGRTPATPAGIGFLRLLVSQSQLFVRSRVLLVARQSRTQLQRHTIFEQTGCGL